MTSLVELFCDVDDFWTVYQSHLMAKQLGETRKRGPAPNLSPSEVMTIIVFFHMVRFRDFKTYYTDFVQVYLTDEFPKLVSYSRFVELMVLPAKEMTCVYASPVVILQ